MFVLKQCKCGGTHFVRDDDETLRCEECWSRAEMVFVKDEVEEKESDE